MASNQHLAVFYAKGWGSSKRCHFVARPVHSRCAEHGRVDQALGFWPMEWPGGLGHARISRWPARGVLVRRLHQREGDRLVIVAILWLRYPTVHQHQPILPLIAIQQNGQLASGSRQVMPTLRELCHGLWPDQVQRNGQQVWRVGQHTEDPLHIQLWQPRPEGQRNAIARNHIQHSIRPAPGTSSPLDGQQPAVSSRGLLTLTAEVRGVANGWIKLGIWHQTTSDPVMVAMRTTSDSRASPWTCSIRTLSDQRAKMCSFLRASTKTVSVPSLLAILGRYTAG